MPTTEPRASHPPDGLVRPRGRLRTALYRAATVLLLLATVAVVAVLLRDQDWSVLAQTLRERQSGYVVTMVSLSFLANVAALLAALAAWRWLLGEVGDGVTTAGAARVFFAGQVAKYLPGKVFGLAVTVHMGRAMGIPAVRMSAAWLLALVVGLLTGATVGLAAGPEVVGGSTVWFALAALPILVVLVRPGLVRRAADVLARLRRRPPPEVGVPDGTIRGVLLLQSLSWLAGGVHLWLLAVAMGAPPLRALPLCVGVFALGAVAGVFAVFTPDGLGVREVILLTALGLVLPLPVAGAVAVVSRLVVVVSELLTASVGLLATEVLRRRQESAKTPSPPPQIRSSAGTTTPIGGVMGTQPLVSVIIPNYNYATSLSACIEAAQRQSYPAVEVIVVDDCSTDDSLAVARATGARVLRTEVNGGVSVARNLGADHARGEILFFVDSDVALAPDAVEQAVELLQSEGAPGAVCGMYDAEPMFPDTLVKRYRAIQQYVWFNEVDGPIPGLHSALFAIPTSVFREIGPFNTRLRWTEEQDYGFRLNQRYEVRATSAVRGRHDHDGTLGVMLTKVFQRTRLGAPNWVRLRSLPGGAGTGSRALGSGFVLAAALSLPLSLLLGPLALVLTAVLVGVGIALDARTYGYAYRHHGVVFGLQFTALHLLVTLTSAVAAAIGISQAALLPGMTRRLYGVPERA